MNFLCNPVAKVFAAIARLCFSVFLGCGIINVHERGGIVNSMTGYGRAVAQADGREMVVEVRTVNHRFLDLSLRLPRGLNFLENDVRVQAAENLCRGHADITLTYRNTRQDAREVQADIALAGRYMEALRKLGKKIGVKDDIKLSQVAVLPDVITVIEQEEDQDAVRALALGALQEAFDQVAAMRKAEGANLKEDLTAILGRAEARVNLIESMAGDMPLRAKERIENRLKEMAVQGADGSRIAQEAALLADRCAVDEELSRLRSHIAQLRDIFQEPGEIGRRMDFLVQELNREVNTIASKSHDSGMTGIAVELKSDIEKLREQIQNVE